MKRSRKAILAVLTAGCIAATAFGIAACDDSASNTDNQNDTNITQSAPEEAVVYTVTFDTNGGTLLPEQGAEAGDKAVKPGDPKKAGYTFGGWYKDAACTQEYDFNSEITGNTTVYAKWNTAPTTDAGFFRLTQEGEGWAVSAKPGTNLPTDVVIPAEIEGKKVIAIAESGFEDVENIASVTFPDTLTTIGQRAFRGCSDLEVILGGANVEMIYSDAFDNTVWDNNLPAGEVYLGKTLYKYASSIFVETAIEVREGTVGVASGAFLDQPNLTGVTFPGSLKYIGSYAFGAESAEKANGVSEVILPDSVVEVGAAAFRYAPIETLVIGKNVEYIGAKAFADTDVTYLEFNAKNGVFADATFTGLTSPATVKIADEVTEFPENIVKGWDGIVSLDLGKGITVIPAAALDGHAMLSELKTGDLVRIGGNAFRGTGLAELTLPATLTYAGNSAFEGCQNLEKVTINAEKLSISGKTFPIFKNCPALTTVNFGATVREIPDYLFYNSAQLTTVGFSQGLEKIGMYAFYGTALSGKLVLPEGLKVVSDYAFDAGTDAESNSFGTAPVSNLQGLVVPSTLEEVGSQAFANNHALTYLAWNAKNVKTTVYTPRDNNDMNVYVPMFYGCKELKYVNIGDAVASLPEQFVKDCNKIEEIDIKKIKTIGKEAFDGCTALVSLGSNNGANIETLGADAFTGTAWLQNTIAANDGKEYKIGKVLAGFSGTMPEDYTLKIAANSIVAIADGAFKGQKNLKTITITNYSSNTLTSIGASAFEGCTGITSFSTGGSQSKITTIGDRAFYGCTALTTVTLTGVETIGANAFYNCSNLFASEDFTIPASVVTIGDQAFYNVKLTKMALKVASGSKLKSIGYKAFYNMKPATIDLGPCEELGDNWVSYSSFNNLTSFNAPSLRRVGAAGLAALPESAQQEFDFSQIEYLGDMALDGWSLEDYNFPALTSMGIEMFGYYTGYGSHGDGNSFVKNVTFGAPIEEIPAESFYKTANLKTVTLAYPEALKTIGDRAFQESGITTIDISHVTSFGDYAFTKSYLTLEDFTVNPDCVKIGIYAFQLCNDITGTLTIRGKFEELPEYAFANVPYSKVIVGGDIKILGQSSLAYRVTDYRTGTTRSPNPYVSEVIFEEGVESIDQYAFIDRVGESFSLPSTITNAGKPTGFSVIRIAGYIEPKDLAAGSFAAGAFLVCADDETAAQIKTAPVWEAYKDRAYGPADIVAKEWIVNADGVGLKYLGDKTKISIPAEVKSISGISVILGTQAVNLQAAKTFTVAADSGLKYENDTLLSKDGKTLYFYNGTGDTLTNDTATEVKNYAFYYNKTLKTVTLSAAEKVGAYAFASSIVETVNLPKTSTLGTYGFYTAAELKTVTLGDVLKIEDRTFQSCAKLTSITLSKVTEIGMYAFLGCSLLETVSAPMLVTVGNYSFQNCNALSSFTFDNVETIGTSAFTYNALTEIILPKVKTVGASAFRYHTALTKVEIGADCTSIGGYGFADTTNNDFTVICKATAAPTGTANMFGTKAQFKGAIQVPESAVDAYKAATGWTTYTDSISAITE